MPLRKISQRTVKCVILNILSAAVMADENQTSALFRRHEQLKRWHESDTNKCPDIPSIKAKRVKFQDGCIFLAACSSGDRDEVKKLLDRGADINTANIDGLTALHQVYRASVVDIYVHSLSFINQVICFLMQKWAQTLIPCLFNTSKT